MVVPQIKTNNPVKLEQKDIEKYASKIRAKNINFGYASMYQDYWLMAVTKSGRIIEGDSVANGHPQLVTAYVYPDDELISFIAKYIDYQTDEIGKSLMAIYYGDFHIDGHIDDETKEDVCICKFNPFAVTYQTSLLESDLSQFAEMISQLDGKHCGGLNMIGSFEIPFYRNEIQKEIDAQPDWLEKMTLKSNKQKREEYIEGLRSRIKKIQNKAFELLGISDEMVENVKGYSILSKKYNYIASQDRNLYNELCKLTGCTGYEVISKLEELANEKEVDKTQINSK